MNAQAIRLLVVALLAVGAATWFVASQTGTADEGALVASTTQAPTPGMENPKILGWDDLLPEGEATFIAPDAATDFPEFEEQAFTSPETGGADPFDNLSGPMSVAPQPAGNPRPELAGQAVKIAGYMTPLGVEQGKTKTFLLVPYVGACIHVPAPPSNQIVLVETKEPVDVREMWEPFEAIGTLRVESISTDLADVAYTMELDRIEEYVDDLDTMDEAT